MPRVREAIAALRSTVADLRKAGVPDREIGIAMLLAFQADPVKKVIQDDPEIRKGLGDLAEALKKVSELAKSLDDL